MLLPAVVGLPKAGGDWLRCDSAESLLSDGLESSNAML
jgi:hypothetical protein